MAESILRLKVSSEEYDNKLKQATNGLTRYIDGCRKVGGTLEVVEKDTLDYVRAIGQMDTTSRTATGKLAEMKKAFVELSAQYKQMTDAEKNSPIGKALAASLDQLNGRIQDSKTQLDDINKSMNGGGGLSGALDAVAGKFGVSIDMVTKFGGVIGIATTAAKVAKDAFFNNEQMLDEWGRTVESVESVYKGFLNSLNTGDISGFLSNIQTITQAARDAYDALDELSTFNAFNKANIAGARADLTGSIADYREGTGSKDAVKESSDKLIKELETKQKLQEDAYKKVIAKVAAERGVKADDLLKVMQGSYGSFNELKDLEYTGKRTRMVSAGGTFTSGPIMQTVTEAVPANERERLAQAVKHLNDTEIDNFQSIAEAAQMTQVEINNQRKMVARVLNGKQDGTTGGSTGGGRSGGGSKEPTYAPDSIAAQQALVSQLTKQWNEAGSEVRSSYIQPLIEAEAKLKEMKDEQALLKEQAQGRLKGGDVEVPVQANISGSISTSIDEIRDELADNPIKIPIETTTKDVKAIAKAASITADVVGSIGDAFNAIEDPAAKVTGIIMESIANVALGYAKALTMVEEVGGPWAWIAFAASGVATMFTAISAIHSATGYAQGGMIKGDSYSGDNIGGLVDGSQLVGLNAGEVVLNAAQQNSLANTLQGNGMGNINVIGKIRGSDIILSVDRTLQSSGRGQLLTWG